MQGQPQARYIKDQRPLQFLLEGQLSRRFFVLEHRARRSDLAD